MNGQTVGVVQIRKRSASEWMLCFVFFFPFMQAFLTELLGIPDVVKFLCDGFALFLLVEMFAKRRLMVNKIIFPVMLVVFVFLIYTAIVYLFHFQFPFYYLWGLRNNFRFYIIFLAFALLLEWEDATKWLKVLDWLWIVNFLVILFQYFFGFSQDYLGGIFGVQIGCNGNLLLFMTIVVSKSLLLFMRGEGTIGQALFTTASALLISALAELKFFFIVFIIISIMVSVMTKFSFRKTAFIILSAAAVFVFSIVLTTLYENFSYLLSWEGFIESAFNSNYATAEDIGRFTAIPVISKNFLTNIWSKLFGLGLGNCDTSSLSIFNSPFFQTYGQRFHYTYFSSAFLYLEVGAIGLTVVVLLFLLCFIIAWKMYKSKKANEMVCQLALIVAVFSVVFLFYGGSLRSDAAYLFYFVLALPLISYRSAATQSL